MTVEFAMTLGHTQAMSEQLKGRMREMGLTQASIASACGVTQAAVARWMSRRIPAEQVKQLSEITGLSPHELRPDVFGP